MAYEEMHKMFSRSDKPPQPNRRLRMPVEAFSPRLRAFVELLPKSERCWGSNKRRRRASAFRMGWKTLACAHSKTSSRPSSPQ